METDVSFVSPFFFLIYGFFITSYFRHAEHFKDLDGHSTLSVEVSVQK